MNKEVTTFEWFLHFNIGIGLIDFKDFLEKSTTKITRNNDKNIEKIRELFKLKKVPDKTVENLNVNAFPELYYN